MHGEILKLKKHLPICSPTIQDFSSASTSYPKRFESSWYCVIVQTVLLYQTASQQLLLRVISNITLFNNNRISHVSPAFLLTTQRCIINI